MADKRISQLIERVDIANDDVLPIVASGATTTNKVTVSTLQDWMQENVDVGVTSVGITIGSTGTDVNVTGSPVTSSGNITINLPTASATNRGLLSAADWTTFNNKANAGDYVTLGTTQTITAQKTFTTSGSSDTMIISHGSGSGFALDVLKGGNGEAIRVTKTSGSGNAMTISGGNFEAGTIVKTGGTSVQYLMADGSVSTLTNPVTGTGAAGQVAFWNGTNSINSEAEFTYNSSTNLLTIGGGVTLTGAQTIQTSTGNLTLATAAGNGNIVLSAHGDGNVTTNDSIYIGSTSGIDHSGISNKLSVASTGYNLLDVTKFSNDNFGGYFYIGKSRGSTVGDYTIVQNGDQLGSIIWQGSIGTQFQPAAVISAEVDGVPGSSSDMPGRLIFATCSDNSTFAVERLRIDSTGAATFTGALNGTSASFSSSVTASSLIKSGGTSSQFLKADGSVDSSTYLTTSSASSSYLPLAGGTLTGALNGTSATFSSTVQATGLTATSTYSYLYGLRISGNDTGNTIYNPNANIGITSDSGYRIFIGQVSSSTIGINVLTSTGNVGIGTASPTNGKLEIQQSTSAPALWVQTGGTSSSDIVADFRTGSNLPALQILGNGASTFSGNVGIGVTPSAWDSTILTGLQIGTSNPAFFVGRTDAVSQMQIGVNAYYDGTWKHFATNAATRYYQGGGEHYWDTAVSASANSTVAWVERMRITSGGDTEFNFTGGYILKVQADNQINATFNSGGAAMYLNYQGNGAIYAGSSLQTLYAGSDERIKTNIEDAESTLDKVLSLKPRKFKYKERPDNSSYGFIAQEVEEVMPDLVRTFEGITMCVDEEIENQKSVESYSLVWASILVKAIQELKTEIDSLKNQMQ